MLDAYREIVLVDFEFETDQGSGRCPFVLLHMNSVADENFEFLKVSLDWRHPMPPGRT